MEKEFISRCGGKVGGRKKSTEDEYVIIVDNFFEEEGESDDDEAPNQSLIRTNKRIVGKAEKAYSVTDFRKKYPNAYKGWAAEEDKDLAARFTAGESIEDLMETFGRQRGSIRARIVRLGLGEE